MDAEDTEFLDLEDLLWLTRALGAGPVSDVGLLDSARARPMTAVFGEDAYPTLALKAAALLHSLATHHALVDGNKRLALHATAVFLDINDHVIDLDDEAAYRLVMDVAAGHVELSEIADRLGVTPAVDQEG